MAPEAPLQVQGAAAALEDVARLAVDAAMKRGADHADARIVRIATERLAVQGGAVAEADAPEEFGIAVRAFKDGAVGHAAAPGSPRTLREVAPGVARRAFAVARDLAPLRRRPVSLDRGAAAAEGSYATPVREDPFQVPLEEKLDLLLRADRGLGGRREIVATLARMELRRVEQWTATSDGGRTHQVRVRSGGKIEATSRAAGVVERRSHPNGMGGDFRAGGYEVIRGLGLAEQAERVRDEAIALCHAAPCPGGKRTLILGTAQLALQIHESVGHPLELDRMLGGERDLAGGSFAGPGADLSGDLRYGSDLVSFVADPTAECGLDTRGWDDDNVPSEPFDLVRDGALVGAQSGRISAGLAGRPAGTACSRAAGWWAPPIDRITNVSLAPGAGSLEDLIASSEDGTIFADTVRTWSIDQQRRNFQFTCEVAWEIRGGKRARLLRLPTYQGETLSFWRSCDAIAGPEAWRLHGIVNCGKGHPMQIAEMSHGAAPARFRGVQMVGIGAV